MSSNELTVSDLRRIEALVARYKQLEHAMQTGVAYKMEYDPKDTTPKHLRVGINSAMVETGALVQLLIQKGMLTQIEWLEMLVAGLEKEVQSYTDELTRHHGANITLE